MYLTSLSGSVGIPSAASLAAGEAERRLGCELREIGLTVVSDGPGRVVFTTPTVTDGKTGWWLGWRLFAMVSGGAFELQYIAHDVVRYKLSLRTLFFRSIFAPAFLLIFLIPSSISQRNTYLLLFATGFWLTGYFCDRLLLWVRIRGWLRRVISEQIESESV